MDSSRYMAVRGMGTATMRITESERGVRIELTVRGCDMSGGRAMAYLVTDKGTFGVELKDLKAALDSRCAVFAAVIAIEGSGGIRFVLEGTSAPNRVNLEAVKRDIRMKYSPKANAPAKQPTETMRADTAPKAAPVYDKDNESAIETEAAHETNSKPVCETEAEEENKRREEHIEGRSAVLSDILRQAQLLFGPQNEAPPSVPKDDESAAPKQSVQNSPQRTNTVSERQQSGAVPNGLKQEQSVFNPFPAAFPRSVWTRATFPGTNRYYLEGLAMKDGRRLVIHAIPGEYSPAAPRRSGFNKFMRSTDGAGYWLRIRRV